MNVLYRYKNVKKKIGHVLDALSFYQIVDDSMGSQLLAAHLLDLLAGLALLLALAGLYGLLMYLVSQRRQELGVRLALGAQRYDIVRMLLLQAAWLLLLGTAIGSGLAYFSGRLLAGFLYGVSPHDLMTMASGIVLLVLSGLTACYLARAEGSRLNPLEALRCE